MTREIKFAGLGFSALPSAFLSLIGLWIALTLFTAAVLQFPLIEAAFAGLLASLLHYLLETLHQFGHAWAARSTGYPMIGVRYWFLFAASLYPADEPELPAAVHIRRALGGPIFSLLLTIITGLIARLLYPAGALLDWLLLFAFLDNLLVFTLGSLLPLGFTDGSTLLYWWSRR